MLRFEDFRQMERFSDEYFPRFVFYDPMVFRIFSQFFNNVSNGARVFGRIGKPIFFFDDFPERISFFYEIGRSGFQIGFGFLGHGGGNPPFFFLFRRSVGNVALSRIGRNRMLRCPVVIWGK
jgi:hypothetical protein